MGPRPIIWIQCIVRSGERTIQLALMAWIATVAARDDDDGDQQPGHARILWCSSPGCRETLHLKRSWTRRGRAARSRGHAAEGQKTWRETTRQSQAKQLTSSLNDNYRQEFAPGVRGLAALGGSVGLTGAILPCKASVIISLSHAASRWALNSCSTVARPA